ncbi:MAG: spore germination protein [Firmicutes bacterium]|nr:spore germination protein [Bacillota bacterium]
MLENIKLTREQTFFLIFICALGNIVYTHTWIDDEADRAAWVAALAGILLVTPFAVWMLYLGENYPEKNLLDIVEDGLGKFPGGIVSCVYILINVAVAVAILNLFTELIKSVFLPKTPVGVIMLILVLVAVSIISSGLKAFSRTAELLTGLGLANFFFSFVFSVPKYFHTEYIFPVFDTSWLGFIKGTLFMTGAASECLLLIMIIVRFIPDPGKHCLWVVTGLVFCAVVFSAAILVIMAMLSPELAKRIAFGGVNAARIIQVGEFIRGLEVFIFITYQFIAIGKISVCLYCGWTAVQKILHNIKPWLSLAALSSVVLALSFWLNSYNKAYQLAVVLGTYILLPFSILMLLICTILLIVKKKKSDAMDS